MTHQTTAPQDGNATDPVVGAQAADPEQDGAQQPQPVEDQAGAPPHA